MKQKLQEPQGLWLHKLTTTYSDWLKREWDYETFERVLIIIQSGEYDYFDQSILNDIRKEWLCIYGKG